jgi:hypothetical protein
MKNKIFIYLGVGSVIALGYYFLQKNKPTISQSQLNSLNKDTTSLIEEKLTLPNSSTTVNPSKDTGSVYVPTQYTNSPTTLDSEIRASECAGLSRRECIEITNTIKNNIVNNSLGISDTPKYVPTTPVYVTDVTQVGTSTVRGTTSSTPSTTVNTRVYAIGRRG